MMRDYELSYVADRDLDDIWRYTYRTWGERQASKYLRQIKRHIESLAKKPQRGRSRDDVSPGLLCSHVGRHFVLYRQAEKGIRVLRVLHDQMDVPERMRQSPENGDAPRRP